MEVALGRRECSFPLGMKRDDCCSAAVAMEEVGEGSRRLEEMTGEVVEEGSIDRQRARTPASKKVGLDLIELTTSQRLGMAQRLSHLPVANDHSSYPVELWEVS